MTIVDLTQCVCEIFEMQTPTIQLLFVDQILKKTYFQIFHAACCKIKAIRPWNLIHLICINEDGPKS